MKESHSPARWKKVLPILLLLILLYRLGYAVGKIAAYIG